MQRFLDPAGTLHGRHLAVLALVVAMLGIGAGVAAARSSVFVLPLVLMSFVSQSQWAIYVRSKRGVPFSMETEGALSTSRILAGILGGGVLLVVVGFLGFYLGGIAIKYLFDVVLGLFAPAVFIIEVRRLSRECTGTLQ